MAPPFIAAVVRSLRVPRGLLLAFFVTFARFEYALKAAGFRKLPPADAEVSWGEFKKWLGTVSPSELAHVLSEGRYLIERPPKKLVMANDIPSWETPARAGQSDIQFLIEGIRRARNNLFHGGKWLTPPEPPGRNARVLATGLAVLHALVALPSAHNFRMHFDVLP